MEDEDWGGEEPLKDGSEGTPPSDTEAQYGAFGTDQAAVDFCVISNSPEDLKLPTETFAEKPSEPPPQNEPATPSENLKTLPETSAENLPQDDEAGLSGICPICLQPVDGEAYLDPCFHRFCFSCILHWGATNRSGNAPLCPVCKGPFLTIIHDFRGVQFKRYDVLGGQSAAQFHLSEKHVLRRGVYTEGGATKPLGFRKGLEGFRRGFGRTNGRWLRCWVRRELQALLEEEDVEMVALHIVGSVELMAQRLKERQRFGRNARHLTSSDGGEPELLVASLKKPPRKEKQLVFGKTSLVLSKAGLARRKARKSVNGAVMSATAEVKDGAKILKKDKEREKRESAARKVMRWFNEGATHQQGLEAQQEGPESANDDETAPEETIGERPQVEIKTSENSLQREHEGSADRMNSVQPPSETLAGEETIEGASQGLAKNAEGGKESAGVSKIEKQLETEARVHIPAGKRDSGRQSVRKKRSELSGGAGEPRELTPEDKEWLEIVASQARPFVFEHADRFAAELMAFLDSGLDIASYDAATLPLPAGNGSLAVESPSKDLALLKRAIEEENEGDYHVEGMSVERPRKKRPGKQEQQYGSLWTAAKEDLAALPREEEHFGPEREVKRRKKKRGDEEERRKKRKHSEKSEEDSDFERRQHRKHKRRRDRHRRHRRERADSVDKSDSSLEKAVHAYRKKLRKRRKDGRRLYDGLPLSSTDDEAESWVEWRKRMKKLYRFCKTEVDEESEQSSGDSFWGDTKEARKRREEGSSSKGNEAQVREQNGPSSSGWERAEGRKSRSNGDRSHGDSHRRSESAASDRRRGDSFTEQASAGLQRSHEEAATSIGNVTRGAKARDNCLPRRGGLKRSSGDQSGGDNLAAGVSKKQVRVRWKDEEMERNEERGIRFSDASEKRVDVSETEHPRESLKDHETLRAGARILRTSEKALPLLDGLRGDSSEAYDVRGDLDGTNEGVCWQNREETQQTPTAKRRVVVGLSELADRSAGIGVERQSRSTCEEPAGDADNPEPSVGFEGLQAELREVELRKKALANLSMFLKTKSTAGKRTAPGVSSGAGLEVAKKKGVVGKKLANGQKASNGPTQAGAPMMQGAKVVVRKFQTGLSEPQATVQNRIVQKLPVGDTKRSILHKVPDVAVPTRADETEKVRQTAVRQIVVRAGKAPGKGTVLGKKEPGQAGVGNGKLPGARLIVNRVAKAQVGSQRAVPGSNQPSTSPAQPNKAGGERASGQLSVQANPKQVQARTTGNQIGQSIKTGLSAPQAKKPLNGLAAKTAAPNSKSLEGATLVAGKTALARTVPIMHPQKIGVSPRGPFQTNQMSTGVSSKLRWVRSGALTPTLPKPGNTQKPLLAQPKPVSIQTSMATNSSPVEKGPLKQPKPSGAQTQPKIAEGCNPASVRTANTSTNGQPKASPSSRFAIKQASVTPLQKPPAFVATSIAKSKGCAQPQIHQPLPGPHHLGSRTWQRTTAAASSVNKTGLTPSNTKLRWVRKEVKPNQGPLEAVSITKTGAG